MKKIKKFLKFSFLVTLLIITFGVCGSVIFYHATTQGLALDTNKLTETKTANQIQIYDSLGNSITRQTQSYIPITKLSEDTKNAFICAEDKRFYEHNGIDLIRMAKATISNIKSLSFSQGASTISQQLIKNTQLTNEKTLTRKLKEIKLTMSLEKEFTKEQILEMYLNNIYFGNGCYGIESASKHYFSKSATNLSVAEAATLAATINAPSFYDPEDKPENVKSRRNLILKLMQNNNKISEKDYKTAISEKISLNLQSLSCNNFLFDEILNEACNILNTTPNKIANNNLKIFTNLDIDLINNINKTIKTNYLNLESKPFVASIIIDNNTNKIISITGNKTILSTKKQPGSTIKPILVFAPAIEKNLISPATKILDEPIDISGYKPTNSNGKYHGYVSVRESLENSYNIPAVKILNELGISNAQNFAKNLGIEFTESDNNLAIALGGFTEGVTLKTLADAYCCLANKGNFVVSNYITKITKNSQTIYKNESKNNQVMKESTAFLITDMLKGTAKSGTAKRLKDFSFDIAAKTGTVGVSNSSQNKESFCVSYTTNHTILTYFGGTLMPENINGSTYPTMLAKDIYSELYKENIPENFKQPKTIQKVNLNKNNYDKNILSTSEDDEKSITEYFANENLPKSNSIPFKIAVYNFEDKKPVIEFETTSEYSYEIIRKHKEKEEIISSSISDSNIKFEDKSAISGEIYEYFVRFTKLSNNNKTKSNHISLKSF